MPPSVSGCGKILRVAWSGNGTPVQGRARLAPVGRLGSERVLSNLIERHSFVGQAHSRPARVRASHWLRARAGRADWHRIARANRNVPNGVQPT
jgi:hypothetical protein